MNDDTIRQKAELQSLLHRLTVDERRALRYILNSRSYSAIRATPQGANYIDRLSDAIGRRKTQVYVALGKLQDLGLVGYIDEDVTTTAEKVLKRARELRACHDPVLYQDKVIEAALLFPPDAEKWLGCKPEDVLKDFQER